VLDLVRRMVDRGHAQVLMGNHEYNAIAFWTPDGQGGHLRERTPERRDAHRKFTSHYESRREALTSVLDFFYSLPLVLELPGGPRVVHACWSDRHVAALRAHPLVDDDRLTPAFMHAARKRPGQDRQTAEYEIADVLLKGPEVPVAEPFHDAQGTPRWRARYRWWGPGPRDDAARILLDHGAPPRTGRIPAAHLPDVDRADPTPVLFGHYWWIDALEPPSVGPDWACLDHSVALGGHLAAYRWREGDRELRPERLVRVRAGA
jgi:hypothetical protein